MPVTGIRVSIASGFRECTPEPPLNTIQASDACDFEDQAPSRRARSIIHRAERAAGATADGDALHATGLGWIFFGSDRGTASLDAAIADLRAASVLKERPATAFADLAAAYLARAERGNAQDLFRALEAAEQALELDPRNLAARFNAAMALDRAGLWRQAAEEWRRYRAADTGSAHAEVASRRLRALSVRARLTLPPPLSSAAPAEFERFATLSPERARDLAWDHLLHEWGIAVLIHDTARARLRLEQAAAIGGVLSARRTDPSLADEVLAVRQHAKDARSLRRAATAHLAFAEGRAAVKARRPREARLAFSRAVEIGGFRPLHSWAETNHSNHSYATGTPAHNALIRELATRSDSLRYPAVTGTLWRQLGFMFLWQGQPQQAKVHFLHALSLLERAGEDEKAFETIALLGLMEIDSNNRAAGYEALHRALIGLSSHPASSIRALNGLANASASDGLHRAALRIRDEEVSASGTLSLKDQSQARSERARQRLAAGRMDIDADLMASMASTSKLDYGTVLWLAADYRRSRAEQWIATNPLKAAENFDSLANIFASNPVQRVQVSLLAAEARLAAGRVDAADADLRRVIAILDSTHFHVNDLYLRNWLLQNAPLVFDRAVMRSLRDGRVARALDYMDQGRAALSSVSRAVGWSKRPPATRRGEVAVELALVGDTLLAWTLAGGAVHLDRRTIDRAEFARTMERLRYALESGSERAARTRLEALYDQVIRPVEPRLGPRGTPLVIVMNGEFAAIPFAALRDRKRGRHLVEDHPLRFVSSLRDPIHAVRPPVVGGAVTLIADPGFDRETDPQLPPLRGAVDEIASLARLYPEAKLLGGPYAHAEAIEAAFRSGGIVHFAGHALVDNERSERSSLVVASSGPTGRNRVTAREIERMALSRLRLVILSACETSWAPADRSGGFAGLAGAFLAAGAGGVVGSLWRVDDENTRVLMEAFHRAYALSGDGTQALRQAQLEMLRSGDPALASPTTWAAFQYAGS